MNEIIFKLNLYLLNAYEKISLKILLYGVTTVFRTNIVFQNQLQVYNNITYYFLYNIVNKRQKQKKSTINYMLDKTVNLFCLVWL